MLLVKAFHIIFVITWFAGLFYLPRLFVYHADAEDTPSNERFKIMERKLFAIMTIGGLGALFFGVWLTVDYAWAAYRDSLWLHLKFALVTLLVVFHAYCGLLVREFRYDRNRHGQRYFRWLNEVPAVILIAVVVLAVVKPF